MHVEWVSYFAIHAETEVIAETSFKSLCLDQFILEVLNFLKLSVL